MIVSSRLAACVALCGAVAVALGAACFPAPYEELGKRCDEVEHRCSDGLFCVDGRCAESPAPPEADAGPDSGPSDDGGEDASVDSGTDAGVDAGPPPNLLKNPDFELPADGGSPPFWKVTGFANVTAEKMRVHGGKQAARVVSYAADASTSQLTSSAVSIPGNLHYCLAGWVYVPKDGGLIPRLSIREFTSTTGTVQQAYFSADDGGAYDAWLLIDGDYGAQGANKLEVRVIQSATTDGATFFVDDLDLWQSVDCTPR